MRGFKALAIVLVCGAAMTAPADAADPPAQFPFPDFKKQIYTDLVSGWYVRGDLGYRKTTIGAVEPPSDPLVSWSIQNVPTLGFGGGYKYKWFRADATLDYGNRAKFTGNTATTTGFYTAKIDTFTLLANVYLDLGEWGGFTPYVGAGVGTSNVRMHEYTNPVFGAVSTGTTRWNLSWAYMGGVSFRFSPNLLLDVSYRYLKLGDAATGPEPPATPTATYFRDLSAQEIRVGIRLMLD